MLRLSKDIIEQTKKINAYVLISDKNIELNKRAVIYTYEDLLAINDSF